MRAAAGHRARRLARALAVAAGLLTAMGVHGQTGGSRLLIVDLPYQQVWANAVRAVEGACAVTRAEAGVIECARAERLPRPDETGLEKVAERVVVRVEGLAGLTTRISVDVQAEGLRAGRWEPVEGGATAQAVLARIRAAQG